MNTISRLPPHIGHTLPCDGCALNFGAAKNRLRVEIPVDEVEAAFRKTLGAS